MSPTDRLKPLVDEVAAQSHDLSTSIEQERTARAALLAEVLEIVQPAAAALSSKLGWPDEPGLVVDEAPGSKLVMTASGTLLDVDVIGISKRPISARTAIEHYDVGNIVGTLERKLGEYADGSVGKVAWKARERAAVFEALRVLIRSTGKR